MARHAGEAPCTSQDAQRCFWGCKTNQKNLHSPSPEGFTEQTSFFE